jgi:hypothetical protein
MFGPGDALFGTLADLARLLPVLPLIGGGHTRLQPRLIAAGSCFHPPIKKRVASASVYAQHLQAGFLGLSSSRIAHHASAEGAGD